jgi:23S rRNA (guanosine2251-2'-O)-methyltransferase
MSKNKANLWGLHAVRTAWQNKKRNISHLFLSEQTARDFHAFRAVNGVKRPAPIIVNRKELDQMCGGGVHQGIALLVEPLPEIVLSDLLVRAVQREKGLILILDQVTDPHNVGAILRSACAFGACGMVMQRKHAPELEGVLAKTACGAVEHVPVAYETNLSRSIETLQENNWTVIGLDERGAMEIAECRGHQKVALVLGAEGAGLRPNVAAHCDLLARLEMRGPMPSINVSNAAAVALYALT